MYRMDSRYPKRIIRVKDSTLGQGVFQGNWVDILEEMMDYLGVKTKVKVKIMSFYDGSILAKYRVALMLPQELGVGLRMPFGKAKHVDTAFQIAILEAITDVRTKKFSQLEGTQFHALPRENYKTETEVDHLTFAKTNPVETAQYLDSFLRLIRTYHRTHHLVSGELEAVLEDNTDPEEAQERRDAMEYEASIDHHEPPPTPRIYPDDEEVEPETPVFQFTLEVPAYSPRGVDDWEVPDPESPFDGSEEWNTEPYAGTESDPILFIDSDTEEVVNPKPRRNKRVGRSATNPILIDSDEEDEPWRREHQIDIDDEGSSVRKVKIERVNYYDQEDEYDSEAAAYEFLGQYFTMTDLALEHPDDPEYVPHKEVKLHGTLHRTSRNSWWKPGKYAEE